MLRCLVFSLVKVHIVLGTTGRRYVRLSSPTFHRCVRNTPSDWTAAQNGRFFNAANVSDRADVVDTGYGGYQAPGATGPYGFYRMQLNVDASVLQVTGRTWHGPLTGRYNTCAARFVS